MSYHIGIELRADRPLPPPGLASLIETPDHLLFAAGPVKCTDTSGNFRK